jgi:serine/threonine-protein kinase
MAATYSSLVGLAIGGRYEIRRVIGVGGMGVVCEAEHLDLGKRVAVKLIDKSMKESESIIARFRREAKAAGRIQSEHIVDVFDVNADPRVGLYMVMEHLTGEDLQARIERERRIDVKTAVMIAHQIARGLAKAHEAGVIHRDLKPANVFLTERDSGQLLVKLLDFGVSKLLLDTKGDARITGSGTPIGTPLYMSPEQAEGKDDVDGRADIWSLGAVLYEALSGGPPFADRGSYHGTIVGILTSRAKLLGDVAPWVPAPLAKVVDAMLVHDRDARIPNAAAVTQRLLDAFPQVLPDGTGRHTAVIVPQTLASVDATGDTEIFTSSDLNAVRISSTPNPAIVRPREDSTKTVPDPVSSDGEALRTAAATPVAIGADPSTTTPPPSPPVASGVTSSAQGIALPATPAEIDPLPPSELAPETTRDEELARRAERRRIVSMALLALAIAGVAIGGYLAGRRANEHAATTTAPAPPPPPVTTAAAATAAIAEPTATATATASAEPTTTAAAASALPNAPASAAPPPHKPRAAPKASAAPKPAASAPLTPYDEPPPPEPPPGY